MERKYEKRMYAGETKGKQSIQNYETQQTKNKCRRNSMKILKGEP